MLSRWSAEKNGKGHQVQLLALQKPDSADRSSPCKRAGERAVQAPCVLGYLQVLLVQRQWH